VRSTALGAVALLSLLVVAAADPEGDVAPCPPGSKGRGDPRIDIVEATGEIIERGTALRFTITFGQAFEAPDTEGRPLRVDVVLRDPDVPTVDFAYYRDLNRIVRFDAVADPALQIVLLPERGANVFLGAVALGATVTMTLPGRVVTRDADLEGLGLERMRWGVIARDERDCDALGEGRPTERLDAETSPPPVPSPDASTGRPSTPTNAPTVAPGTVPPSSGDDPPGWLIWSPLVIALVALWVTALWLRRRTGGLADEAPAEP
jgi:hypothetical protein